MRDFSSPLIHREEDAFSLSNLSVVIAHARLLTHHQAERQPPDSSSEKPSCATIVKY